MSAEIECDQDKKLCEKISVFIGKEKLTFTSSQEYTVVEDELIRYDLMQKGAIEINNNTYNATLYYNSKVSDDEVAFTGNLEVSSLNWLEGGILILGVKGKQ